MEILWYLIFCSVGVASVKINKRDLFTLINGNSIVCATDDEDTPIYISPPSEDEDIEAPNLMKTATWLNDDWSYKNSSNFVENITLDKRFEDFKIINSNNLTFSSPIYISFSVYGKWDLMFKSYKDEILKLKKVETVDGLTKTVDVWTHFFISCEESKVNFFKNGKSIDSWEDFVPNKLQVFSIGNKAFWKIHEYEFKWADKVTTEKPTQLTIPAMGKSYVVLYYYLCKNCKLEFSVNKNEIQTFSSTQENWERYDIPIEPHKETELWFWRRNNESTKGFWAIDIRLGAEMKNNYLIFRENVANVTNNTFCKFLTESDHDDNNTTDFLSINGNLNEDITCKDILGVEFPHCEKHRICKNSKCECAWGYHGPTCNSSCPSGKWGLSCHNNCSCENCIKTTGECENNGSALLWGLVGSAVVVILAVIFGIVGFILRKKRNQDKVITYLPTPAEDF